MPREPGCLGIAPGPPDRHASRMRGARTPLLACALLLAGSCAVATPGASAAILSGRVMAAGQPVARAFVAATGVAGSAAAVTDAAGAYSLTLPDGTYRVAANASGFSSLVLGKVQVSGPTGQDLALTASQANLKAVPLYGGGVDVAADGKPGVFYLLGANVGEVYRTLDWGGNWTQVTATPDDAAWGLPEAAAPQSIATSGYPGEVAVALADGSVFYSTDYGVTWSIVGGAPTTPAFDTTELLWGHAGSRSVLLLLTNRTSGIFVADMTASLPSFARMSAAYSEGGAITVADGVDRPWVATADDSGVVRLFPLTATLIAPPATMTLSGFGRYPEAIGLGGASAPGKPPAGIVVSSLYHAAMSIKPPGSDRYPPPLDAALDGNTCRTGSDARFHSNQNRVAPNTTGSYGAAWVEGCWIQDLGDRLKTAPAGTSSVAIDSGYNATDTSPGSDAVVMVDPFLPGGGPPPYLEVTKWAASDSGNPVPPADQTLVAQPGTDPSSGGAAETGVVKAG